MDEEFNIQRQEQIIFRYYLDRQMILVYLLT